MARMFDKFTVKELQTYLKERDVTTTKLRRNELLSLCQAAYQQNIEVDPDGKAESIGEHIKIKLTTNRGVLRSPETLQGSGDMSCLPNIDRFDVYNYLISYDTYDHQSLKSFKKLEGCQLNQAGYIEKIILCKNTGLDGYFVVKYQCKPKQRKEDPVNKVPYYNGWVVLDCEMPAIFSAFCACKGGSDGGCRHIVACLFEISQYEEEININSVTSGPCQWTKKQRVNDDKPLVSSDLQITLHGSSNRLAPVVSSYDPCPELSVDVNDFYSGMKTLYPEANILLNRFKKEELLKPKTEITCDIKTLSERIISMHTKPVNRNMFAEIIEKLQFTEAEIKEVKISTRTVKVKILCG